MKKAQKNQSPADDPPLGPSLAVDVAILGNIQVDFGEDDDPEDDRLQLTCLTNDEYEVVTIVFDRQQVRRLYRVLRGLTAWMRREDRASPDEDAA